MRSNKERQEKQGTLRDSSKIDYVFMATGKDISYQTEYPVKPNTSYQAYLHSLGLGSGQETHVGLKKWYLTHFGNKPTYDQWKSDLMDSHNADLNAYNTWLQSGAGIRKSAESGDYNPNYFGEGSQASPLEYQSPQGVDAAQGVQDIAGFVGNIVTLLGGIESVKGQALKNQAQETTNKYLDEQLKRRNARLGFLADWQEFTNAAQAFSMYGGNGSDLYSGGFGTYDISPTTTGRGLMYQTALANLDFIRAGKELRYYQGQLANFNAQERKFFVENMQELEKQLLQGQVDWQETEKQMRQNAQTAGIANQTTRTILEIAKFVASLFGIHIPEISTTEIFDGSGEVIGGKQTTIRKGK